MNALSNLWGSHRGFEDSSLSVWTGYKFLQNLLFFVMHFYAFRHWLLTFCKGTFALVQNNLFFGMCFSVPFLPRSLVSARFSRKFYLLFLPLGNNILEKVKEEFLKNVCSEEKTSAGEMDMLLQKQQTRAAKLGFSSWNSKMLPLIGEELTKFPVLKWIFLLGKSRFSHTLKIISCRESGNWNSWNYYFNQFLGQQKCPPLGKKRTPLEKTPQWQLLALFKKLKNLFDVLKIFKIFSCPFRSCWKTTW